MAPVQNPNGVHIYKRKDSRIRPRIDLVRMDNPPLSATALADIIREICKTHAVPLNSVVLFGSRITGKAGEQSDWDFLIITKKTNNSQSETKNSFGYPEKDTIYL